MAEVSISRQWADGDAIQVTIEADGFPDALDEAKAVALRLYAGALGITIETEATDTPTNPEIG